MNRTAKGWLTDARSHINAAIEMLEKQTDLKQGYLILSHISDAWLSLTKSASALPGVPDGIFPPDPDPEGLAQIAKLDAAEHVEWIVQHSINLPNVHIGLFKGHKAVITDTGINKVWQVEVGTFLATFDSLDRAKESAEIVLRNRAERAPIPPASFPPFQKSQHDPAAWVNPALISPPSSDQRIADYERSYQHALHLGEFIMKRDYPDNPAWKPEGDLPGLMTQIDNMVAGLGRNTPDPLPQLSADYEALKDAGNAMAAASFRVATEYDGCHRLMLAVSDWARAVANEGGRGNAG